MPEDLVSRIFPLLFASSEPVPLEALAKVLGVGQSRLAVGLESLATTAGRLGLRVRTRRVQLEDGPTDGFFLETDPAAESDLRRLRNQRLPRKLSPYARKTLLILMRASQPMTKKEIEEIRGPSSGERRRYLDVGPVLKTLIAEGLVSEAGRLDEQPGRPKLYRATARAGERFPRVGELAVQILARTE